jgi:hypothetical protein
MLRADAVIAARGIVRRSIIICEKLIENGKELSATRLEKKTMYGRR